MARRRPLLVLYWLAAGALLVAAVQVEGGRASSRDGAKTVYVYDSNAGANGFDHNCKGWIWSQLNFLDKAGKPAGDGSKVGDQITVDGQKRGTVVSAAGGKANGYGNGTDEAFDLARGATLKDAYGRLKAGDRLVICKHGGSHTHAKPGGNISHDGGLIHLDGGQTYAGFKEQGTKGPGTNVNKKGDRPIADPYVLPSPPAKGSIKATLYGCWTGKVPADGERSVKQSLEDVLGEGTVDAFDGVVKSKLTYAIDVENAASEEEAKKLRERAEKKLEAAATKAGFPNDVDGWLTNTPFEQQYSAANDVLSKDPELKGKASVSFEYPTPDPPVPIGPGSEVPVFVQSGGVRLTFGRPAAVLVLPRGAVRGRGLDLVLLQADAQRMRRGPGALASRVLQIASARDGNPTLTTRLVRRGRLTLPYFPRSARPHVYRLQGGRWVRLAGVVVRKSAATVSFPVARFGTFAAFR